MPNAGNKERVWRSKKSKISVLTYSLCIKKRTIKSRIFKKCK
jgi:hypothetical protein